MNTSLSPSAIVTGASGGIGQAILEKLVAQNFHVFACDIQPLQFAEQSRKNIEFCHMDVSDYQQVIEISEKIKQHNIQVLINAAGVHIKTPIDKLNPSQLKKMIDTNLIGAVHCISVFSSLMKKQRYGRIINIASIAGVAGAAFSSIYAASKGGMIALTQSLARELAPNGIAVNAIAPGYCDTKMIENEKGIIEKFSLARVPLNRLAKPEEVAELACFLATCQSDYITGNVIKIDGGLTVG